MHEGILASVIDVCADNLPQKPRDMKRHNSMTLPPKRPDKKIDYRSPQANRSSLPSSPLKLMGMVKLSKTIDENLTIDKRIQLPKEKRIPLPSDGFKIPGIKDEVHQINCLLDEVSKTETDVFGQRLMDVHNYALNEIVLQERTICSDRAILLRRIQQYFNQISKSIPQISESYTVQLEYLRSAINDHQENLEQKNKELVEKSKNIQELTQENEMLQKEITRLHDSISQKDSKNHDLKYETDYLKGKQLNMEMIIHKKKEKTTFLQDCIKSRDEQIESLNKTIDQLKSKISELQALGHINEDTYEKMQKLLIDNTRLTKEITEIRDIEKTDIGIEPVFYHIASKRSGEKKAKSNAGRLKTGEITMSGILPHLYTNKETQSEHYQEKYLSISESIIFNLINESQEDKHIDVQIIKKKRHLSDETDVQMPNLLTFIISSLVIPPNFEEPVLQQSKLMNDNLSYVVKSKKNCSWGLQLIHEFFSDPFLRTMVHSSEKSFEDVFTDWLENKYKLKHLITQVLADFSFFLIQYSELDDYIKLFIEILDGKYSTTQVMIFSTIYTFAASGTTPLLLDTISNNRVTPGETSVINVSADVVHRIISKCFSSDIADSFMKKYSDTNTLFDQFIRNALEFCGEKHKMLHSQLKNLLRLCGCPEIRSISFAAFSNLCHIIGFKENLKNSWKSMLVRNEDQHGNCISYSSLLVFFSERRKPLMDILELPPLSRSMELMSSMSETVLDLFHDIRRRYSVFQSVLEKINQRIKSQVKPILNELRYAILRADLPRMLWLYRKALSLIDSSTLDDFGFMPFPACNNQEIIEIIMNYYNKLEAISFAFIE